MHQASQACKHASYLGYIAGQDPEIAKATAHYMLATIPTLVLMGISETGKRYLMAQNVVTPLAVRNTIPALLDPPSVCC